MKMEDKKNNRKKLILELFKDQLYVPMKRKELAIFMQVSEADRDSFDECLDELIAEGKVELSKRGKLTIAPEKKAAQIEDTTVGTFDACSNFGFVIPDNGKFEKDIFIPLEKINGATDASKVLVKITDFGHPGKNPEGEVIRVIGHVTDPGVDILSIALAFGMPESFPEKVLNQAERLNKPVIEKDLDGREDLRDLLTVTIDGDDSKDFDDAVSLQMDGSDYILGVHIADVANYVQENSAADKEAYKRGTSVYLADRVIPMLPEALSNGICSLNEGEDRLTLSCIMRFDAKGGIKDYRICESAIRSRHRLTYREVNLIITEDDPELSRRYEDAVPMLKQMQELSLILRERRVKRGALDFDFPETKIVLDDKGVPVDTRPYERNEATKLIESFMLAANETVAEHYYWQGLPFLYRVHGEPEDEKIKKLQTFIKNFGYSIKGTGNEIHPKEFQKLLAKIEGTDKEALISRLVLRSMQQARYSPSCDGHFGLACEYYTHFTSPIRRYPDLQIHRIIKDDLRGRLTETKRSHYFSILPEVAESTSRLERRAAECERETVKLEKARYMQDHIGDIYNGIISGVTGWGIYVELENTVEGLVHISTLTGDYYIFDENRYEIYGERNGVTYRLGESVKVMVKSVDIAERYVDFIIADFDELSPIHDFYKEGRHIF